MGENMQVVVAHDYLTQHGGAERVALELARGLKADRLVTSLYAPDQTFDGFRDFTVQESSWRLLHAFRSDPRRALPLLARAWSRMQPIDADVVVCSSSGWAHGLPTTEGTMKVVYCHNPARWLYQAEDYETDAGAAARLALTALTPGLKRWDQRAAATAHVYVANSTSVAERIHRVYGVEAAVVHPPVSIDADAPQVPVPGVQPGYFLTVGRARGYKGTQTLIEAFAGLEGERLVVVGVEPTPDLPINVTAVGRVDEDRLRWLYAHARALTSVSHEDFGLTPIEAAAFGTPSLLLRAGGFLDSTVEGVTGAFIDGESIAGVQSAVRSFGDGWDAAALRAHADRFSPPSFIAQLQSVIAAARV